MPILASIESRGPLWRSGKVFPPQSPQRLAMFPLPVEPLLLAELSASPKKVDESLMDLKFFDGQLELRNPCPATKEAWKAAAKLGSPQNQCDATSRRGLVAVSSMQMLHVHFSLLHGHPPRSGFSEYMSPTGTFDLACFAFLHIPSLLRQKLKRRLLRNTH